MKFSIVMPCEEERLPLLFKTLEAYEQLTEFDDCEVLVPSRSIKGGLARVKVIPYSFEGEDFNPSMALNIGVRESKYDNIIITSPEVKPFTNVLKQFSDKGRGNYVAQVFDLAADGRRVMSLVNTKFRSTYPSMYFLALFKKEDLEAINGWDEAFMAGYAWEDNDFGERFVRAGLKFEVLDEVIAEHQWHARKGMGKGWKINQQILDQNRKNEVVRIKNGIKTINT